ncbi:hypothetical protein BAUCODRAFT_32212 [Baudoinia panamericana UAMH 10762]|uniref:Uncharacterized protein n=1 Tax=Baudoinia panamericana (strain UAMH 10762) TaxID=717646 RepID=M2NG08_BAUPA|nr:uncharacterized protein BAUCODRAFT_32212 [Baudoinia panamericana UAMH 10762]EMC98219.1 hypothetical protein BAUCODRAFT_32212 [Baudoinia panamericana UAMH 10762]
MGTLLRSLTDRLTPNASSVNLSEKVQRDDGFYTAKTTDALFPRTKPEIDGEECLHDCESCTVHYPRKFEIDEDDKLYGQINGWDRHLIVATGKTDWVRDVEEEKGSVMEAVGKHREAVQGGKLMLSASNMPTPSDFHGEGDGKGTYHRATTVLLLPAFQFVDNVTPEKTPALIQSVINKASTNTQPLPTTGNLVNGHSDEPKSSADLPSLASLQISQESLPDGLSLRSCPHKYLILLCSQATRDARCGQSAPLLRREFERHLRPLGLYRDLGDERPGGVGIYFISHVGGHKYSANMLVYRRAEVSRSVEEQMENGTDAGVGGMVGGRTKSQEVGEAAQCIWLARIRPEDCENVVRFTVLQGKVVKPERQLRGGFDREKCIVSW